MNSTSSIESLNDLTVHVFDSIEGYRTASEHSTNERLSTAFASLSERREEMAQEMQDQVRSLGGTPEDEGSLAGMAHRGFLRLRDAVMGQDNDSVLAEVDRGEDYLKERFAAALADNDLDPAVRERIGQWHEEILEDHRTIQQWRTFAG